MSDPQIPAGKWSIDPVHSRVGFVARHMMVSKIRGTFTDFTGDVTIAEDLSQSSVVVEFQMESIETGNKDRDGHLRTNDFFDVAQYPTMTFKSTSIEVDDGNEGTLHGELTLKGRTNPVTLDVEFEGLGGDPWGGTRAGFSASGTINRKDWGVEWNAPLETGGVMVGDKVQIELDIQMVKQTDD
jgi:polyisoprenoid-binding protein YceI